MYHATDKQSAWRSYGVEWMGESITINPPTLKHATRVLDRLRNIDVSIRDIKHVWNDDVCSCGAETVICQGCGKPVCSEIAVWIDDLSSPAFPHRGGGNVEPACLATFGRGHAGVTSDMEK